MLVDGKGERVVLRNLRIEDWWQVVEWEQDEEILQYIGKKRLTVPPWSDTKGVLPVRFGSGVVVNRHWPVAIESENGSLIGYVELREINWRRRAAELRICIGDKAYWGKGYGTEAMRIFLRLSFSRFKLDHIYLRVYRNNQRAVRCYEKCGFIIEGILPAGPRSGEDDIVLMRIYREWVEGKGLAG